MHQNGWTSLVVGLVHLHSEAAKAEEAACSSINLYHTLARATLSRLTTERLCMYICICYYTTGLQFYTHILKGTQYIAYGSSGRRAASSSRNCGQQEPRSLIYTMRKKYHHKKV